MTSGFILEFIKKIAKGHSPYQARKCTALIYHFWGKRAKNGPGFEPVISRLGAHCANASV